METPNAWLLTMQSLRWLARLRLGRAERSRTSKRIHLVRGPVCISAANARSNVLHRTYAARALRPRLESDRGLTLRL
eukprot:10720190-Alexandrium_andersonii.AAC.1